MQVRRGVMSDYSDYAFTQSEGGPSEPAGPFRGRRNQIIAGAVVLLAAVVLYLVFGGDAPEEVREVEAPPAVAVPAPPPASAEPPPIVLPVLDESDTLVRDLVRALSSHPSVATWLATDGLIRNFTVVVENISNGQTPTPHLQVWRPDAGFTVIEDDESTILDTRSYARYASVADAVDGVDPAGAAQLYATLKARIQEAYADLGYQQSFDVALERAIVLLLRTPITDNVVLLEPVGALWAYADPMLESLSPPQKQLLRMGPRNARRVQATLRAVAVATGIPADRLP
jgi:hypothetical protein